MNRQASSFRFSLLLVLMGASLYSYIDRENNLTKAELMLAPVCREVGEMEEQNAAMRYQLSRFEAPSHLFQIAREAPYGHLGATDGQTLALSTEVEVEEATPSHAPQPRIASSAR